MKTPLKTRAIFVALAACLSSIPIALAQTPQPEQVIHQGHAGWVDLPPEVIAANEKAAQLSRVAAASLHAGRYAQAEEESRQSLSFGQNAGVANEVLAAALDAQGKEQEALQAYQDVVVHYDNQPRILLPYALLLLKSDQWEKAVATYNTAISRFSESDLVRTNSHFSSDVLDPKALAVAIHIARGIIYNGSCNWAAESQNQEAMGEYQKALQLAPDSDLANYYYGSGWQQLSPEEQVKFATVQQARAALQKAVKYGKGDVKQAAKKALQVAMNAK